MTKITVALAFLLLPATLLAEENKTSFSSKFVCMAEVGASHNIRFYDKARRMSINELLLFGAKNENQDLVSCALKNGANVNSRSKINGRTALHYAVINQNQYLAEVLINYWADPNIKDIWDNTALHELAQNLHNDVSVDYYIFMTDLLSKEADPNVKNKYGQTPLHLAIRNGYEYLAEALVFYGVDINSTDNEGKTALHYAIRRGVRGNLEFVISSLGANINQQDNYGRTALHYVILDTRQVEIQENQVKVLLANGADPNIKDRDGNTALHHLAMQFHLNRYVEITELLLDHGAKINIQNNRGKIPLSYTRGKISSEKFAQSLGSEIIPQQFPIKKRQKISHDK